MVATIISRVRNRVVVAFAAVLALLCVACSNTSDIYNEFKTIGDNGWHASVPLKFFPNIADSTITSCNVLLAVRHNNAYAYSRLDLVVDMIDSNHKVTRRVVNFELADEHGNWLGTGFGRLYQTQVVVAQGVNPCELHDIVVWPTMKGLDKVENIENVGVFIVPN